MKTCSTLRQSKLGWKGNKYLQILSLAAFFGLLSLSQKSFADDVLKLDELKEHSDYKGKDNDRRKAVCSLSVSDKKRPPTGRPYREFNIVIEGTEVKLNLKYFGVEQEIEPTEERDNGKKYLYDLILYDLANQKHSIQMISDSKITYNVLDFSVYNKDGVTGTDKLISHCEQVKGKAL